MNGFIKYDMEANDCFFVEWQTGVIRTSCMLDRENVSIYLVSQILFICHRFLIYEM